jgi:hypothetical protein
MRAINWVNMASAALRSGMAPLFPGAFASCALRGSVGMDTITALKLFYPADRIINAVVDHPLVIRPVLLSHFA